MVRPIGRLDIASWVSSESGSYQHHTWPLASIPSVLTTPLLSEVSFSPPVCHVKSSLHDQSLDWPMCGQLMALLHLEGSCDFWEPSFFSSFQQCSIQPFLSWPVAGLSHLAHLPNSLHTISYIFKWKICPLWSFKSYIYVFLIRKLDYIHHGAQIQRRG